MLDPSQGIPDDGVAVPGERRGRLPVDEHALDAAEYKMLDRPYGTTPQMAGFKKVMAYSGNTSPATGSPTRSRTR